MADTLQAQKILSYIVAVLEPLGPREPRIPIDHLAESSIGPCLDLVHRTIALVGRDSPAALRLLSELKEALHRAEADCRGDDLDTVSARHLNPLNRRAWEVAERLAASPTMTSERVREVVASERLIVSTHPYFELAVCLALRAEAERLISAAERNP